MIPRCCIRWYGMGGSRRRTAQDQVLIGVMHTRGEISGEDLDVGFFVVSLVEEITCRDSR